MILCRSGAGPPEWRPSPQWTIIRREQGDERDGQDQASRPPEPKEHGSHQAQGAQGPQHEASEGNVSVQAEALEAVGPCPSSGRKECR